MLTGKRRSSGNLTMCPGDEPGLFLLPKKQEYLPKPGWTQKQLAEAAGLSHGYISAIEQGRKTPGMAVRRM